VKGKGRARKSINNNNIILCTAQIGIFEYYFKGQNEREKIVECDRNQNTATIYKYLLT
jgi:hypothetical protein